MVEQWNRVGGTVEQCRCKSGTVFVEQWNSESGTVLWNSGIVMVEECGATVEQCWWNSWWNSGTVLVE